MKKIYMPSIEELEEMEARGADIYKYILVKAAESLIVEGINHQNVGMLKNAYKYLREDPNIARAVCLLYPNEIKYSKIASYDNELLVKLLEKVSNNTIYNLDNLAYFDNSTTKIDCIVNSTIDKLSKELPNNPEYRFEYQNSNLLNSIFSTKLLEQILFISYDNYIKLSTIEPAYAILTAGGLISDKKIDNSIRNNILSYGISEYTKRYGINSFIDDKKDLLSDANIKKLIKNINRNKYNLY